MDCIFSYKKQNVYKLEPLLEIYRGKLYLYLTKKFINDCIDNLGMNIFSIKKSFSRTLTNLLSTWMFSLYVNYDFSGDYFFPSNYQNTELLETILTDLCKYDETIVEPKNKINIIINNLKYNYSTQLNMLENYKKSIYFITNKNNYKVKKTNLINNNKKFIKFEILLSFKIKDIKLINILNNVLIPENIYNKLESRYTGKI
jgi:hypothetical protein